MPSFPSPEPTVSYFDDLNYFKHFEKEFPVIVYNDALTSKLDFLIEPTVCPQYINEFNLKDETSLSECDEEETNVLYFNDLFPFYIIYPDYSKSDKDNDEDKIDIKQSSKDLSIKPLPNVINTDDGAYAHGLNKLLETSHDTSNKFFKTETFIKELNVNIMAWNYFNNRMLLNLIKNLYVPFGIPFDPKLFYKDGIKLGFYSNEYVIGSCMSIPLLRPNVIREILKLDDAEGIVCLPNEEIFVGFAQMGYEKPSTKLTFYKAFFSSQWKFLIHTILQSLSTKRTSWNEFSTNQVGDLSTHTTRFISPALTQKVFVNMRRVRNGFLEVETPLFEGMLAARQPAEEGLTEAQVQADDAAVQENVTEDVAHDAIPSPPSHDIPSPS
nr:hypothetical protein [Tanacetum cinerariifolium]